MSTASPAPGGGGNKPIKLDFANRRYGAAPNVEAKHRDPDAFITQYRAYQWTTGHDVKVTHCDPVRATLECATHPGCPFSITSKKIIFESGKLIGQVGFIILPPPAFQPTHSHPPFYHPLDLAAENDRRLRLPLNDPSLSHPPGLIPLISPPQAPTLASLLTSIHPSLGTPQILDLLEAGGIPRDTDPQDLLDLEEEVFDVFKGIAGLDPLFPALVQDGVKRANARKAAGGEGLDGGLDPAEKKAIEEWVLVSIAAQEKKSRQEREDSGAGVSMVLV